MLQFSHRAPQLELGDDLSRQSAQRCVLGLGELTRLPVDHAQGTQCVPVSRYQRCAGIETDTWFGGHQRVVSESFVLRGVFNNEQRIGIEDGIRAEGKVARRFRHVEPVCGLEPLPFLVHEADDCDRRVADL